MYREIAQAGSPIEDLASLVKEANGDERLVAVVCAQSAEDRAVFEAVTGWATLGRHDDLPFLRLFADLG